MTRSERDAIRETVERRSNEPFCQAMEQDPLILALLDMADDAERRMDAALQRSTARGFASLLADAEAKVARRDSALRSLDQTIRDLLADAPRRWRRKAQARPEVEESRTRLNGYYRSTRYSGWTDTEYL